MGSPITLSTVLEQSEGAATGAGGGSVATGGGGGVQDWDDLTGTLSGDVPFETVGADGTPVARGAAFTDGDDGTGDGNGINYRWQRDPASNLAFKVVNEEIGTDLLTLDEDGNLQTAGDVIAFSDGSGSGGSGGGGTAFQTGRSLAFDGTTDPHTLNVELREGANVDLSVVDGKYEISSSGAVSSVFGRTGAVAAQAGDYDADQISGFDAAAVDAIESTRINKLRLANEEFSSTYSRGRGTVVFDKSAGLAYYNNASNAPNNRTGWHRILDTGVLNVGSEMTLTKDGTEGAMYLSVDQGNGSRLNADMLDGYEGGDLAVLSEDEIVTGDWLFKDTNPTITTTTGSAELHFSESDDGTTAAKIAYDGKNEGGADNHVWIGPANNNKHVVVENGGNVGINTSNPYSTFHVNGGVRASSFRMGDGEALRVNSEGGYWGQYTEAYAFWAYDSNDTTSEGGFVFGDWGTGGKSPWVEIGDQVSYGVMDVMGSMKVGGTVHATGPVESEGDVIAFVSSDRRLKAKHRPIADPLSSIHHLRGRSFEWEQGHHREGIRDYGLIAQDVVDVYPHAVRGLEGYPEQTLDLHYDQMVPLLTEGIKALDRKLESETDRLRRRVSELESQVDHPRQN